MELDYLSLLEAVFESTADGILIVSDEGKVLQFNTRFKELWRIPQSLLDTKDDQKLLSFIIDQLSEPDEFINKVNELYKNPDAISHDNIAFKDGRFFDRYSKPLVSRGKIAGRVWRFRDITNERKSREVFETITELSPDIISIINDKGELVYNSSASERIHGYSNTEMLNKNTFQFIHSEDQPKVIAAMTEAMSKPDEIVTVQYRYKNKDGTWAWMEAKASNQIENPYIRGLVCISREIGDRKRLEEELTAAIKLRDEFISITSHELKTPITGLKLQLQMLQRKRNTQSDKGLLPRSGDVNSLLDQVQSLQRLIDDLLSVSKIRTGRLSFEPEFENFSGIVSQMLERFSKIFEESRNTVEASIAPDIFVFCDKLRIQQVIGNIFSNVTKYGAGTTVKIELTSDNNHVYLNVRDYGPGIPREKREQIFALFERLSTELTTTGLGIGLFISRSIVEQHYGSLTCEEVEGPGAKFMLRLPKAFQKK